MKARGVAIGVAVASSTTTASDQARSDFGPMRRGISRSQPLR
jgi:hypothetical protein